MKKKKYNNFEIISDMISKQFLCPEGFEEAVIGYVERCSQFPLVLLDTTKCLQILMKRDGMSETEAWKFFEFNILYAWIGEYTPCFATLIE